MNIEIDEKQYNSIYQDIFEHFGIDVMKHIYTNYRGQSFSFPINLINPKWKRIQIKADYEQGMTIKDLAKKYEYTEHRIRIIINSFDEIISNKD